MSSFQTRSQAVARIVDRTATQHSNALTSNKKIMVKMINGSRHYRALESVEHSISFIYRLRTLTIYPCRLRVHQILTALTPTSYSLEEGVVVGHSGQFSPHGYLSTVIFNY